MIEKMSKDRQEIYKAIDTEREYQTILTKKKLSIVEEILIAKKYLSKAEEDWLVDFEGKEVEALENLRKVAGIIVRCLENHGVENRKIKKPNKITKNKIK